MMQVINNGALTCMMLLILQIFVESPPPPGACHNIPGFGDAAGNKSPDVMNINRQNTEQNVRE